MDTKNQSRKNRGRRKENTSPHFSSYVTSEQRNVQKNVNINLFLDTEGHAIVSRHWDNPTITVSSRTGETVRGRPCAAFIGNRGAKSRRHVLVQTNLPCSDWPFQDITGTFFNSSSRQQSNLESKLQRCGAENVTCSDDSYPLSTADFGPRHSCWDRVTLKVSSPNVISDNSWYQSQKPAAGFGLSHTCSDLCKRRLGNKDQHVLNQPVGHPSVSERNSGNLRGYPDSFSSTKSSIIPSNSSLLRDHLPSPKSSSQGVNSFTLGPPLTLDLLNSSTSVDSEASSATLQALICSSQTSANLHSSIQQFKKEAAQMGALGSFPWESKTAPPPYRSCFDPGVMTSILLGTPEESCARQASVKWRTSFARDWGLSSTIDASGDANSIPIGFGCKNTGLCASPMVDHFWPTVALSGIDSTPLAFQAKENYSRPSFCYPDCCSGFQNVPEGKASCHLLKSHYNQRTSNLEDSFSRLFCCPKLSDKDFPLGLPSFDGLEVSLESQCAETPVNKEVAMYDTQRDVHLTIGLPRVPRMTPVCHFGTSSEALDICELQSEPEGIGGTPITAYSMDDYTPFLPPYKPSPFRIIAGNGEHPWMADGTGGAGVAKAERNPGGSPHFNCEDNDQTSREDLEESTKFPLLEKQRHVRDVGATEKLERDHESMGGQRLRPVSQQQDTLLKKSFGAWRDHVLEKKKAAQALYEQQLLRKGLGALKWALQLRDVEVGIARRSHTLAVLTTSFRRWKAMAAKKQKEQGMAQEAVTPGQGVPASPGKERVLKCPVWCQLSAKQLKEAAQYSRAEGNLWLQLHRMQEMAELCTKAQGVRDVRRLAAAFRLWHLQKENQEKEEAQLQEALAILEKRRLQNAFQVWRSRSHAIRQILPLEARVQRALISRCFNAWKCFAEREAHCRQCLEHQRTQSLVQSFRQWILMAKIRDRARKSLLELFTLKRRKSYGPKAPMTETCSNVAKLSQSNGAVALEGLYHALRVQSAFQIWAARWREHQQANAFHHVLEQRQLRQDLRWWHWKALHVNNLSGNPSDLTEEPLLASLDLEETSVSSGFHSSAPALPASRGMFDKENSPGSDSQTSISSLVTIEDSGHLPQSNSPSLPHFPDPEDFVAVSAESCKQVSSLRNCYVGENDSLKDNFKTLGFLSPNDKFQPSAPSLMQEGAQSRSHETENQWQLLIRCFGIWSAQTRKNLKAKQHHRHSLLARAPIWQYGHEPSLLPASWLSLVNDSFSPGSLARPIPKLGPAVPALREEQHRSEILCNKRHHILSQHSDWRWQYAGGHNAAVAPEPHPFHMFFIHWALAVTHTTARQVALVQFERARQQRLLASSFEKWKAESVRVVQRQREKDQQWRLSKPSTWWHQRKAAWVFRAQHVDSIERACNYWTRAATFGLCSRQRGSLIGTRKFAKMPLSLRTIVWGRRMKRIHPSLAPNSRLMCSSVRNWLMLYRNQSKTLEPIVQRPLENQRVAGATVLPAQIHESNFAADYRRWLGRKYLRRWRDNIRVRHFHDAWKMRHLVRAWLLWKDAWRTALGVQDLARHRLLLWSWQTWRRRCLQSWVAEQFLEAADRRLLERVFGRWQRQAGSCIKGKVHS